MNVIELRKVNEYNDDGNDNNDEYNDNIGMMGNQQCRTLQWVADAGWKI